MIKKENKTLLLVIAVGIAMIVLFAICTAYAEVNSWVYSAEDIDVIVTIYQDEYDYENEWIVIADGEGDLAVRTTIYGRPEWSMELSKTLAYFGLDAEKCLDRINKRLSYLKVLVELGLDEGNW